jgi:acetyl esterase/lipase
VPTEYGGPENARGGMLLIHGGAWRLHGPGSVRDLRPDAARFAALGLRTAIPDYHPLARSLPDVVAAYDALAAHLPAGAPICALGHSSGGQLALLLALRRPALRCVIAVAAPTDLANLAADGSRTVARYARSAWVSSRGGLAGHSPVSLARRLHVPVLLAGLVDDPIVSFRQQLRMFSAYPRARLIPVRRGAVPFVHGAGDADDLATLWAAEAALVKSMY